MFRTSIFLQQSYTVDLLTDCENMFMISFWNVIVTLSKSGKMGPLKKSRSSTFIFCSGYRYCISIFVVFHKE